MIQNAYVSAVQRRGCPLLTDDFRAFLCENVVFALLGPEFSVSGLPLIVSGTYDTMNQKSSSALGFSPIVLAPTYSLTFGLSITPGVGAGTGIMTMGQGVGDLTGLSFGIDVSAGLETGLTIPITGWEEPRVSYELPTGL